MGTIATFRPAQTPTNQQWFQLPINEMYQILSDTQTRSDIARSEAEELSNKTFNNLPYDEPLAQEKKKWLTSSVDRLTEDYGEDPLKWSAGLQALKREVRKEFDPSTGTIGKMQARYDQVLARNAKLDEDHKDNPLVRDYLKDNYTLKPITGDINQTDWGVIPGKEYRDVPEKEVNEWFNTNLDNIEEQTMRRFGLSRYGSLNDYTEAWLKDSSIGIPPEKVMDALVFNIPDEFLYSYYQKALASGSPTAESELSFLEYTPDGKVATDNGTYGLDVQGSTIARKIYGYMTGKSYEKDNTDVLSITDELLKDEILKKRKEAEENAKNEFIGWQKTGAAYDMVTPWGTSESSVQNYVAQKDADNDAFAKQLLSGGVVDQSIIPDISADALMDGLIEIGSYTLDGNPIVKVKGKSGTTHVIQNLSKEAWETFKGNYERNATMKALAEQDLLEAKTYAADYMVKKYNKDFETILKEFEHQVKAPKDGTSIPEASRLLEHFNAVQIQGSKGGPRYFDNTIQDYITQEEYAALDARVSQLGLGPSDKIAYKQYANDRSSLEKDYYGVLESQLAPNVMFSTLYTNDYGLSPGLNDKANKQLLTEFQYANAQNMEGYTVGQRNKMTVEAIMKKATQDMKGKLDVQVTSVKKAMSPNPDGIYNWEVVYQVKAEGDNAGLPKSISILIPEGSAGLNSPAIESLNYNPHARAAKATTWAKMFGLKEFTLPDMQNVKLQGAENGDWVIINGNKTTPDAAIKALATEYAVRDIMAIWDVDYDSAVAKYKDMYGLNFDETYNNPNPMPEVTDPNAQQ